MVLWVWCICVYNMDDLIVSKNLSNLFCPDAKAPGSVQMQKQNCDIEAMI
jgi:hypothetical protein